MFDVIIIGAGPAGISASLYTKRANLNTLVLHYGESNLQKAKMIENYYGFPNGISGEELYEAGIKQATNLGIQVKDEEILKIEIEAKDNKNIFHVITTDNRYSSRSIILALGAKKNKLQIKGIKELEGKGISYCAVCDGFFYRNKNIAVIGSGNYAISETNELINLAKEITILTDGKTAPEIRADNVKIVPKKIREVRGETRVEEVEFEDNTKLPVDGIFVANGIAGSSEFAKKLGILTNKENIVVNENMETNIPGIYACGDCTGGILQVSKAVYEGAKAGLEVIKYVRNKN